MPAVACLQCSQPRNTEAAVCPHCGTRAAGSPVDLTATTLSPLEVQALLQFEPRVQVARRRRPSSTARRLALVLALVVIGDLGFWFVLRLLGVAPLQALVGGLAMLVIGLGAIVWTRRAALGSEPMSRFVEGSAPHQAAPTPTSLPLPRGPRLQLSLDAGTPAPKRPRRMPESTRPPLREIRAITARPITGSDDAGDSRPDGGRHLN